MAFLPSVPKTRPQIDLAGPDGNAFVLMAYASRYGRDLGFDKEEIRSIHEEMKESDYIHLVRTFDKYFGEYVDLVLPPNWSWGEDRSLSEPSINGFPTDLETPSIPPSNKFKK